MKKTLFALLALFILAGILVITRPGKKQHTDVIAQTIISAMGNNEKMENPQVSNFVRNSIKGAITTVMEVEDYYIFNIGKMNYAGSEKRISIGALGQVYVIDKENILGKKKK